MRQFSSKPEPHLTEPPPNVPEYWVGHPEALSKQAGMNRFVWDLRYPSPPVLRHEYPISALYENTPGLPLGPQVLPGKYELQLTVNGRSFKQPLEVGVDPRVDVSSTALEQQLEPEKKVIDLVVASYQLYHQALLLHEGVAASEEKVAREDEAAAKALKDFEQKALKIQGLETGGGGGGGGAVGKPKPTFVLLNRELGSLASTIDGQDAAPTPAMQTAYQDYCHDLTTTVTNWNDLIKSDLPSVNDQLAKQRLAPLAASPLTFQGSCR